MNVKQALTCKFYACSIEFLGEFEPYKPDTKPAEKLPMRKEPNSRKKGGNDIFSGQPFEPVKVYKMLHTIKSESEFKV